jgi:hypothetical protein
MMYICVMKNISILLIIILIFMSSCSKDIYSVKKPTRQEIKKGMKYSTWKYYQPTQSIYSNYKFTKYDN